MYQAFLVPTQCTKNEQNGHRFRNYLEYNNAKRKTSYAILKNVMVRVNIGPSDKGEENIEAIDLLEMVHIYFNLLEESPQ